MRIARDCNVCGFRCFAPVNCRCPAYGCHGIMCQVVTPVPGKRLVGYLYRDKPRYPKLYHSSSEVMFVADSESDPPNKKIDGVWIGWSTFAWSAEEWQEQYGKLPRKGSKTAIILEPTHDE